MSSVNVLPSAPPAPLSETQNLYPNLPVVEQQFSTTPDKNFRLEKVNEIASTLSQEVTHYRLVGKKYKRANKIVKWLAGGASCLSAVASSASLGTALSVIGIPAAVPLGALGGCLAIASCGLIITGKKLESKIKKHQEIVTLAIAKRDTVDRLVSKAINDNCVSDAEFQIIVSELEQYNTLKEKVRAKLMQHSSRKNVADVEQIKKDIRCEVEAEFQKKINNIASFASS